MTFERTLTIANKKGLHARASARFVKVAQQFNADISVSRDGASVNARSIMGLMMLAASRGCTITLSATGPEAEDALNALERLVAERFGEDG